MRALFSLALVATVVAAKGGKKKTRRVESGDDADFVKFAAKMNKNYKNKEDFDLRQSTWKAHEDKIAKKNKKASKGDAKALRLENNWTGDLTDQEFADLLSLQTESAESVAEPEHQKMKKDGKKALKGKKGRKMQGEIRAFDHVEAGHMTPVKNQGQCGSCWAFAATTVMEGTLAATTSQAPVRLSEQQLMDCDQRSFGCRGGSVVYAMYNSNGYGSQPYDSYPYEGVVGTCRFDASQVTARVNAINNHSMEQDNTVLMDALDEYPLYVGVDASFDDFRFYKSGVFTGIDEPDLELGETETKVCSPNVNHAVVLTGYSMGGEEKTEVSFIEEWVCEPYYVFWFICEWQTVETATTVPGGAPYFKLQNSWGPLWGQDGYMLVDMNGGDSQGICGMRREIFGMGIVPFTWEV